MHRDGISEALPELSSNVPAIEQDKLAAMNVLIRRRIAILYDTLPQPPVVTETDWIDKAACKGLTTLFFPAPKERPQAKLKRESLAKQTCASCVVQQCCEYYAATNCVDGIWAGANEEERAQKGHTIPNTNNRTAKRTRQVRETISE